EAGFRWGAGAVCGFGGCTLQRGCGGGVGIAMTDEVVIHHGTTMVRRLRLALGEAMPWHRDPFHRVAVVLGGDVLLIEYRDGGESLRVEISPGQVDWEEPSARVHRGVTW